MNTRFIAATIINEVTQGSSLTTCLEKNLSPIKDPRDRAFVQAICYGVCRFYTYLDVVLSCLLTKPMKEKDSDIHALLLVGLYQLIDMRIPEHAAVAETVAAVNPKKSWARSLVNAILRNYLREKDDIAKKIKSDEEAVYAHPAWWINAIKTAWPNHWQQILTENNKQPSFSLRINSAVISRDNYLHRLQEANIPAEMIAETTHGIVLNTPMNVDDLPGFNAGLVSVQDGAAQLAAELLELKPQQRILDACAAPGGKLQHILELEPSVTCIAIDKNTERLQTIKQNLARVKLSAQCICADAGDTKKWWDGKLFDRILLDAPCSASGVIRRHPDIKLLRQPQDIAQNAQEQLRLLQTLWPLLADYGLLLYVTCSIFPQENSEVIQQFLAEHADAKEEPIHASWGIACQYGRQILPGEMDGFYYVRMRKIPPQE
jgi:16S rRNA (cytosine967-C5)-methyltransferase